MAKSKNRYLDLLLSFFLKSYRISSIDQASLKEKPIVVFGGYQVLAYSVYLFFVLLLLAFLLTAYTPLKNLLPQNVILKRGEIIELMVRVDSLEHDLSLKSQYVSALGQILSGEVLDSVITISSDSSIVFDNLNLSPSRADSLLRNLVKNEDLYNIPVSYEPSYSGLEDLVFFKPVDGLITSHFDVSKQHFGVDVVTNGDATVKATLGGVVIFSDWSVSGGHTILIQHPENIISVYMHNSLVTKHSNELVKTGEVIGVVGNSGELSSGPHLHFELWQNGSPINPLDYIDF